MRSSRRNAWFAVHCLVAPVALAGCGVWTPTRADDRAPHPEVSSARPACTEWDTYDADWHRRHCDDPIHWCNVPDTIGTSGGGTTGTTGGAGSKGSATGAAGVAGSTGAGGAAGSADSKGSTAGAAGVGGSTGCGGAAGGAGSTGGGGAAGTGAGGKVTTRDAGVSEADTGASVGSALDGGYAIADAGHPMGGEGACVVGASCPQAGTSCVTGLCQTCPGGSCSCQRDDDCSAMQICDHDTATCKSPPPACTALTTEATCSARVDCTPFYGGMSCTNNVGSPCHSGEANCTCATYSFAACVARD